MANKKFQYKASGPDKMIGLVVILTFVLFGLIVWGDREYTSNTDRSSSSNDIQNLINERDRLQAEIEKYKQEGE